MAILQVILAFIMRQLSTILQTTLGWATAMLFGHVPQKNQYVLTGLTFGSLIWIVVLLGIISPHIGSFLMAYALPSDEYAGLIRIAMLVAALILPALVGFATLFATERTARPKNARETFRVILRGYPYTLGLALTLIMMTIFAPVMKVRDLVRRRTTEHLPAMIAAKDYLTVVDEVQRALEEHGFPTARGRASWMLRLPTWIFVSLARNAAAGLVASEMVELVSDRLEIQLHPADIVIHGKDRDVMRVRALLSQYLVFTHAHLTWTQKANEFEDDLFAVWKRLADGHGSDGALAAIDAIDRRIEQAALTYDEWEVLFREKLLVEERILRSAAHA